MMILTPIKWLRTSFPRTGITAELKRELKTLQLKFCKCSKRAGTKPTEGLEDIIAHDTFDANYAHVVEADNCRMDVRHDEEDVRQEKIRSEGYHQVEQGSLWKRSMDAPPNPKVQRTNFSASCGGKGNERGLLRPSSGGRRNCILL